ncbi:MAG: MarR family transcriptional regulator [Cyanobacteria bacterium J083]|nr:MAG: MarR family transcriptional regulator [Cyanobacteria bacterium J083]
MGLTPCQFDVIATLGQTQGMNMRQLAETTLVTKGTLTGIIDRLEKKNLVRREVPEGNRRSFRVVLTEEGEELFKIAFPSQVNYLKQRLGRLSPNDLAQIESALQKLKNVL